MFNNSIPKLRLNVSHHPEIPDTPCMTTVQRHSFRSSGLTCRPSLDG